MSSSESYVLHYWPSIPGRGEYVRLAFEAAKQDYKDNDDVKQLQKLVMKADGDVSHPYHFAPPIIEIVRPASAADDNKNKFNVEENQHDTKSGPASSVYLSQTPAILAYLAPKLNLIGNVNSLSDFEKQIRQAHIHQIVLTLLDLSNEIHDSHHPVAVGLYYEDQKTEAKKRTNDLCNNRIPKFFQLFELDIKNNPSDKHRLIGDRTTIADLVLFQIVDGLKFALPRLVVSLEQKGTFNHIFRLHAEIYDELQEYLESDRRRKYSNGIFRHYPELDGELQG